jgi:hypothetical protein
VHLVAATTSWDPFPPVRHAEDAEHRRAANRAVAVSAIGLALTGLTELDIALLSGSVGLLGDAPPDHGACPPLGQPRGRRRGSRTPDLMRVMRPRSVKGCQLM